MGDLILVYWVLTRLTAAESVLARDRSDPIIGNPAAIAQL